MALLALNGLSEQLVCGLRSCALIVPLVLAPDHFCEWWETNGRGQGGCAPGPFQVLDLWHQRHLNSAGSPASLRKSLALLWTDFPNVRFSGHGATKLCSSRLLPFATGCLLNNSFVSVSSLIAQFLGLWRPTWFSFVLQGTYQCQLSSHFSKPRFHRFSWWPTPLSTSYRRIPLLWLLLLT